MPNEHISKQFDVELETIRTRVLQMGGLVEQQIGNAVQALLDGDTDRLSQVMADDVQVNAMEVRLDEECQLIIARRQPAARDLRMVMTVIKTITDLERIGDEAEKIARVGKSMLEGDRVFVPRLREIEKMAEVATSMLRRALDAFARLDAQGALDVARQDRLLDEEFSANLRQLITFMMEDPRTISMSLIPFSSPRPSSALATTPKTWPNTWCIWSRAKTSATFRWKMSNVRGCKP